MDNEINQECPEERWTALAKAIEEANEKILPERKWRKKKPWMTDEIIDMIKSRRLAKGNDEARYRELNRQIHRECVAKKEQWMNNHCKEIEELDKRNQTLKYQKIAEVTKKRTWKNNRAIKKKDGTVVMELEEVKKRWEEHIQDLFKDEGRPRTLELNLDNNEEGPSILKVEIENAIKGMKRGKAAGEDGITIEMIRAMGDIAVDTITDIANRIYNSSRVTEQMCKSIFIKIPKVNGTLECGKHRTISIMSQITKIILRVITKRIRTKIRQQVADEQFGFVEGKGTSNAIFSLRILAERAIEKQKNLYTCFIDYEKAFDRVKHENLLKMLAQINIDKKDIMLIQNLYWQQKAAMKIEDEETEWQWIERGVRQGCVMSPDLFSLYGEIIMRSIYEHEGIKVGGVNINNLRFADDSVLIADSEEKLQNMLNTLVRESKDKGLNMNIDKTEVMVISKHNYEDSPRIHIRSEDRTVKQVERSKYLGSIISCNGKCEEEIRKRIAMAKQTFGNMKSLLCNRKLSIKSRKAAIKTYIWSILLYGAESWTLNKRMEERVQAMEMWMWRRMMKISWTERKTNEEVLTMIGEKRELLKTIRRRQMKFVGHIMRRGGIESTVLTGMIEGKRGRGRPREKYMDGLVRAVGANGRNATPAQLLQATSDRKRWRFMAANVLEDTAQR